MKFEGIWIQHGKRLVRWHESIHGENENLGHGFVANYERSYSQGHVVLLIPGKNYGKDELFFFETAADAQDFYNGDLRDFECFIGDQHEPCGFAEVSLYEGGRRIATKECAPSPQIKMNQRAEEIKGHRTGRKIVPQDLSED